MSAVTEVFPELNLIQDQSLRKGVEEIWEEIFSEMPWNSIHDVPKGSKATAGEGLVEHIRSVTNMAVAICEVARQYSGRDYNRDLLLAACLLHDASKPVELEPITSTESKESSKAFRKSAIGENVQHGVYTAHKVMQRELPLELVNLIITHTPLSGVRSRTWEAAALFYADFAETDATLSKGGGVLHAEKFLNK